MHTVKLSGNSLLSPAFALVLILTACGGGGGSSTTSVGIDIDTQDAGPPPVTWHSAARPLVERYCSSCHVDGGAAPFPLATYDEVYNKRSALAYVLESDTMPPLGFADLSGAERDLLLTWIADGAPEGDPSQGPYGGVSGFTYHGDTRAIVEKYCVSCHVDGGVAPFPLDSYQKVRSVAAAAAHAVQSGDMPPWPPTNGYSRFKHSRVLAPEEQYALLSWLTKDLAEGNPADYVPPRTEPQGPGGTPDYNIKAPLPQPYTPTLRPDDHRCFAIEWPNEEFSYVTAVDVIPDQVAEVHHVIVNIVEPGDRHYYEGASGQDGNPGWACLLSGGMPGAPLPRQIGGWVPGSPSGYGPEGTGIGIEPGSLLVVQMHYNTLVAEPTPDQSTVLIATTDEVERPSSGFLYTNPLWLREGGMPIPKGAPYTRHAFEVPTDILARLFGGPAGVSAGDEWAMHTGFMHMHNLGETGRVTLVRADGTEQVVVDIRDWDFNWQSTYLLERELLVRPGDRVRLECTWDNSAQNQVIVNGVQQAPRDVEWGDGTGDEMCLTNFLMTVPREGYDYSYQPSVHIESPAYRQQFAPGDPVPLQLLFNNFTLHEPGAHDDGPTGMVDGGVPGAGWQADLEDGYIVVDPATGQLVHDDGDHDHSAPGDDHGGVYTGHYHVYLDTDDDNAEHLTAWDANYFYQLPDDLLPGLHTLRVSLRGEDHHALGVEHEVVIEVVDGARVQAADLIDVNEWVPQSAAADNFAGHRPAAVNCPDNSWYNEDGALEVETGYCDYLSLAQPSQAAIAAGDTLRLVLWHGNLAFDQPATAHVAVTVAGNVVWQEDVAIPARAGIYDLRIPAAFDAPAGSEVEFHLHNHGYNTWTLLELGVER